MYSKTANLLSYRHIVSYLLFFIILCIGFYLRFWQYENTFSLGWDQARDGWKVRDILQGTFVTNGPRTGIGNFYLAPLWYYYLAPFYFFTKLDPVAALYANMVMSAVNFIVFFWVTKKIFGTGWALVGTYFLAVNDYLIEIMRIPWNVSPVLAVSSLIFYCIYQIVFHERYRYTILLTTLVGFFINLHFSFVFLPGIVLASVICMKQKRKFFRYALYSLPLAFIWFIPLIILDIQWKGENTGLLQKLFSNYLIPGFHIRFYIHRLHDALIMIEKICMIHHSIAWGKFIPVIVFGVLSLVDTAKNKKLHYLIALWFFIPSVIYALYSGTTSEYYMLLSAPMAIYILLSIQIKILQFFKKYSLGTVGIVLLCVVWMLYGIQATGGKWVKKNYGGLNEQRDKARKTFNEGGVIEYNEGVPEAYLWQILKDAKRK